MNIQPSPIMRQRSISVSREVSWALKIVAEAARGDGPLKPEYTSDGIAEQLLREGIERDYPGLLATYQKRAAIDQEGVKLAIAMLEKERAAA